LAYRATDTALVDTGREVIRQLPKNTNPQALKVLRLAGYTPDICTRR